MSLEYTPKQLLRMGWRQKEQRHKMNDLQAVLILLFLLVYARAWYIAGRNDERPALKALRDELRELRNKQAMLKEFIEGLRRKPGEYGDLLEREFGYNLALNKILEWIEGE